jgi:GT2 family glycosyltransferase
VNPGSAQGLCSALSVSIVLFRPDLNVLRSTLRSLRDALEEAREAHVIDSARIDIVDNGSVDEPAIDVLVEQSLGGAPWLAIAVRRGHGNVGYGRGHDIAIREARGSYHLVLNPDVVLKSGAITEAARFLEAHPRVGLVTPQVHNGQGGREYLCKRHPGILVLALRGFGPSWLRRPFRRQLDRYEMRDLPADQVATGIPIASGCFMFARRELLQRLGGFSSEYFLYFEDFDLSLRLRRLADIAYVPRVQIVHMGGYAAGKGWKHRRMFLRSAMTFFRHHGWKL